MQAPPAEPDQTIEPIDVYSGERMMGNMMTINHSRVVIQIAAGVAAGVLGLTGLAGFAWMVLWGLALSAFTFLQTGGKLLDYVPGIGGMVYESIFPSMTFVMFWTLAYDFYHVF